MKIPFQGSLTAVVLLSHAQALEAYLGDVELGCIRVCVLIQVWPTGPHTWNEFLHDPQPARKVTGWTIASKTSHNSLQGATYTVSSAYGVEDQNTRAQATVDLACCSNGNVDITGGASYRNTTKVSLPTGVQDLG